MDNTSEAVTWCKVDFLSARLLFVYCVYCLLIYFVLCCAIDAD